jgi:Cu(I)/Ag(I) efflux system membrane fusion protein
MHMDSKTATQGHQGEGVVNSVDLSAGKVNLSHGPIASLDWPAMTMDLDVVETASLRALKPGQKVLFKLVEKRKGKYVISEISVVK